jgi:hypothetical protein
VQPAIAGLVLVDKNNRRRRKVLNTINGIPDSK